MPGLVFPRAPFPEEGDCIPLVPPAPHGHPSHSLRSRSSLSREVAGAIPTCGGTLWMSPHAPYPSASLPMHASSSSSPVISELDRAEGRHSGVLFGCRGCRGFAPTPPLGSSLPRPLSGLRTTPRERGRGFVPQPLRPMAGQGRCLRYASATFGGRMLSIYFFPHFFRGQRYALFSNPPNFLREKCKWRAYVINMFY